MDILEGRTIPELAFVAFQCIFAALMPALIWVYLPSVCKRLYSAIVPHNIPMTVFGASGLVAITPVASYVTGIPSLAFTV